MAIAAEAPPNTTVEELRTAATIIETLVMRLDPHSLPTSALVAASEAFARIARMGEAGTLLLAPTLDTSGAFRKGGYKNAAEMLAQQHGTSVGAAHAKVNTAKKLRARPKTARTSEEEAMEQYRRVHAERHARTWVKNGAWNIAGSTTLDRGAEFMAAVDDERQRLFDEARREGRTDDPAAYLIDAIINVSTGKAGPAPKRPKASMLLRSDAAAIIRGYLEQGEKCEIAGYGPIPITVARWLLHDADVYGVVLEGDDVKAVTSMKRHVPEKIHKAQLARDQCCAVATCTQTKGLERDHIWEFGKQGPTELDNLVLLCRGHHRLKTLFGWRITGPPGARQWLPPPQPDG